MIRLPHKIKLEFLHLHEHPIPKNLAELSSKSRGQLAYRQGIVRCVIEDNDETLSYTDDAHREHVMAVRARMRHFLLRALFTDLLGADHNLSNETLADVARNWFDFLNARVEKPTWPYPLRDIRNDSLAAAVRLPYFTKALEDARFEVKAKDERQEQLRALKAQKSHPEAEFERFSHLMADQDLASIFLSIQSFEGRLQESQILLAKAIAQGDVQAASQLSLLVNKFQGQAYRAAQIERIQAARISAHHSMHTPDAGLSGVSLVQPAPR